MTRFENAGKISQDVVRYLPITPNYVLSIHDKRAAFCDGGRNTHSLCIDAEEVHC